MELSDTAVATGTVRIRVYDNATVRNQVPGFGALSPTETVAQLAECEPLREEIRPNTTCTGLDELRVDNLDENQSINEKATTLHVGDDNTTPAYSNTSLNNKVAETDVASTEDQTTDLKTTSVFGTNQANGETLVECGLVSQGDRLLNHSTFSSVDKTSSISVTIEVTLQFSSA